MENEEKVLTEQSEPTEKKEQKKDKKWLIFALIGLLLLGAVGGTVLFLNQKKTVTFDSNGGSAVAAVKVKKGECVDRPVDPTKAENDFDGWYLGMMKYDFAQPVTADITLKANWIPWNYVTFMVDGKEYAKVHIVNGKVTFPETPKLDGYAFIEWQNQDGYKVDETAEFTENITLNAAFRVYVEISSMKFEKDKYKEAINFNVDPKLIIEPANWAEDITWSSSDESVATVSQSGTVTTVGAGTATITVTSESGKTASCEFEVWIPVHYFEVKGGYEKTVRKGETLQLELVLDPANATEKPKYKSRDTSIATVDQNGKVKALKEGTVLIDIDFEYCSGIAKITVTNKATGIDAPKEMTIEMGETKNIGAKTIPSDSSSKLSYSTSDPIVATVDDKGNVYGREGGSCIITVSTDNGLKKDVKVYVNEYTLLVDLKGTEEAASLPNGTYILFYRSVNRPLYKVSEATLRVTEGGVDKFVNVDIEKLVLKTPNNHLNFWASHNELYATDTSAKELYRVMTYTVHWEYKYTSGGKTRTVKSPEFDITVEPVLSVSVTGTTSISSGLKWNIQNGEGTIDLPTVAGVHRFRIALNQKVTCTYSSNLGVNMSNPTPTAGKPDYYYFDISYSKTTSSSPGWIKFVTSGGQVIYFKSIR